MDRDKAQSRLTEIRSWQFDSNGVLSDSNGTVPPWLGK